MQHMLNAGRIATKKPRANAASSGYCTNHPAAKDKSLGRDLAVRATPIRFWHRCVGCDDSRREAVQLLECAIRRILLYFHACNLSQAVFQSCIEVVVSCISCDSN